MLFNSYPFILLFLPPVLAGYFWLGRRSNLAPVIWLAAASLAFYAIGSWQFLALLLISIAFNYGVGHLLIVAKLTSPHRKAALALGVIGDLLVLGIFKYAGFVTENINALVGTHSRSTSCCRSASPSTRSPRLRSWWTLIAGRSRPMRCRTTRCS
ncbi:hypothetical protein [Bradyrhizobium sp. 159]|uniref:hypothetical protein n=1 Tax=Bradyrhizobium sp. 159 TaxID=2782632 RepID=UPI001FFBED39|nr:hypothetical protein [Bradyrhizobium sp. 159]